MLDRRRLFTAPSTDAKGTIFACGFRWDLFPVSVCPCYLTRNESKTGESVFELASALSVPCSWVWACFSIWCTFDWTSLWEMHSAFIASGLLVNITPLTRPTSCSGLWHRKSLPEQRMKQRTTDCSCCPQLWCAATPPAANALSRKMNVLQLAAQS